jgi:hypothetical protein
VNKWLGTRWRNYCNSSSGGAHRRFVADVEAISREGSHLSKLLRGAAAGWGAKQLGGGCFTTVLVFVILWWVLGHFNVFR